MTNNDNYNNIKKLPNGLEKLKILTYIPKPTKGDYLTGYITRFFIQKVNDKSSPIYEIKASYASNIESKVYYALTSLDWRLNGTPEQIKKSNAASVKIASADIPKIGLYLPNLLQFHKK